MLHLLRAGLSLASLAILVAPAAAQIELGAMYGHGYYQGDLQIDSKYGPLPIGSGEPAFGLYGRYFYNDRLAFAGSATKLSIKGTDARRVATVERNLSFTSDIYEVGLAAEYFPFSAERSVAPYLTIGVAYYHHNPKTDYNGQTVALQPLGTEGQGSPGYASRYSLHRGAVPMGAGVRVAFGRSWVIGVKAKLRVTFFDHLDDVSGAYVNYYDLAQTSGTLAADLSDRAHERTGAEPADRLTGTPRGNPSNFDYYMSAGLTVGYRLGSGSFGGGAGANRYNKCYSF